MKVTAVIFDLDGTLTQPFLDFDQIRKEMGGIKGPILEAMEKMDSTRRNEVESILLHHEKVAAQNAQLNPGAKDILKKLRQQKRKIGLLTRNSKASVQEISQNHGLEFDAIITREEDGPVKPDPHGFLRCCEYLEVSPNNTMMIGDYVFDLQCGNQAGATSVLICTNKDYKSFMDQADYSIHHLEEIHQIIKKLENGQPSN